MSPAGPPADDRIVEQITGEPFLGPRQAALVDAFTARLHSGFPLLQQDLVAYLQTAAFLRLAVPAPQNDSPHTPAAKGPAT